MNHQNGLVIALLASLCGGTLFNAQTVYAGLAFRFETKEGQLLLCEGERELLGYQAEKMTTPKGGEKFKGSNFIHPLRTPSGFLLTDLQPSDHLHHFGLWWPWKYLKVAGRQINCWELQQGAGIIQARKIIQKEASEQKASFSAESVYIDRKAAAGAVTLLTERLDLCVSRYKTASADGYLIDLKLTHLSALDIPIEIEKYRYSGFCLRGTSAWNKTNSIVLTSEGCGRDNSNTTKARWVLAQGVAGKGVDAGILLMSNKENHAHPEPLRTWDSNTSNGAVFINFNPVQEVSQILKPGEAQVRRYRVFAYDGKLSSVEAETVWKTYSTTPAQILERKAE